MDTCMSMQNGFQFATHEDHCILFLFRGWNVNNHIKYAFMIIGVFGMGLLNGALNYIRHRLNENYREDSSLLLNQIYLSLIYGIQVVLAYWIMLLVMTYESGIFISVIFGLVIGYFIFGYIQAKNRLSKNNVSLTNAIYDNQDSHIPCC
ncbi:unnamed protein product [Rotaria sp. Silwood2]|nr:unnamed protein product [Rotaria sp. Silwood2]CAF3968872.1 unnamed protein product [Rotaria sp. Silwood2]